MEASKPPNSTATRAVNGNASATATANGNGNGGPPRPALPPNKVQQYRFPYRPHPPPPPRRRRSRRGCCCVCCLWLTLLLTALIFLAVITAGVFYVLYHPQRPSFSVSSIRLSPVNISSTDLLTSRLDFSVAARNPNRKLVFVYDDVAITAFSGGVKIAEGTIPGFTQSTDNTTLLEARASSSGRSLDPMEASDLRKRKRYPLEFELDTMAGVKIGRFESSRIGFRILCDGIEAASARHNATAATATGATKCKVKLRIKIWNWTLVLKI